MWTSRWPRGPVWWMPPPTSSSSASSRGMSKAWESRSRNSGAARARLSRATGSENRVAAGVRGGREEVRELPRLDQGVVPLGDAPGPLAPHAFEFLDRRLQGGADRPGERFRRAGRDEPAAGARLDQLRNPGDVGADD